MNNTAINKAEELILLHDDDIYYNIIVHKTHNAFRRENIIREHKVIQDDKVETLFRDFTFTKPKDQPSWANVTQASILKTSKSSPVSPKEIHNKDAYENEYNMDILNPCNNDSADEGWKTVTKKNVKNQMFPKMSNHCQLNQQNCLNYTHKTDSTIYLRSLRRYLPYNATKMLYYISVRDGTLHLRPKAT